MNDVSAQVLMLAPQPFFRLRGICLAQLSSLQLLSRLGHKVDLLTFPFGEDFELPGVRVIRVKPWPGISDVPIGFSWRKVALDIRMAAVLFLLLLKRRYAVVHACEESAFLAALAKRLFRFKLVYDMDDVLSQRLAESGRVRSRALIAVLGALERWMIRSADAVITNSADTLAVAKEWAGEDRVFFYDHVPPLSHALASREKNARPLRELGVENGKVIVYAGNLEPYQGVELLLDSLPLVLRADSRTYCVIIGGEPAQIDRLKAKAAALGLTASMRWLGKRPLDESYQIMRSADVLVSPMTQRKAVPMKLYAYLQAGRPIVATRFPNHTQLLDERSAVLVAPEKESMAAGIVRALRQPTDAFPQAPESTRRLQKEAAAISAAYAA